MAVSYNPSISTRDLILCVDAGNIRSYSGSGTVWTNVGDLNAANGATLVNSPTYDATNGGSFVFNGTTNYAIFGNIFNEVFSGLSASFTVSAWVKPSVSTMTNNYIVGKWANTAGMWVLRIGDGTTPDKANFFWSNPGNSAYINQNSTVSITNTSKWYNIVGVYDIMLGEANSMKIYVDSLDTSTYNQNNVGTPGSITTTTADLIIGNRLDMSRGFYGSISNVMIYSRALSSDDVTQNFRAQRGRYGV